MAKQNHEIINSLRDKASLEFKDKVPVMKDSSLDTMETFYRTLQEYPTIRNEFINSLVNKVVASKFYSKVYENPLKIFHNGELPFGTTKEQIFVDRCKAKNFDKYFGATQPDTKDGQSDETPEGSLLGVTTTNVHVMYTEKNYAYKYKISVSELQMKQAFYNANGLSNMVSQLLSRPTSGANIDEYEDMKKTLFNLTEKKNFLGQEIQDGDTLSFKYMPSLEVDMSKPTNLLKAIQSTADKFTFAKTDWNMAQVENWVQSKSDLVLFTDPDTKAELNVDALATLFNIEKGEVQQRIITLDEMPKKVSVDGSSSPVPKKVLGILADKEILECYDVINVTRQFENAEKLCINHFLHKQGSMSTALFCNCVVFYAKEGE